MPGQIIEVKGGVLTAVYTNLVVTVSVDDHDEGFVGGVVVAIPRNPSHTRHGQSEE